MKKPTAVEAIGRPPKANDNSAGRFSKSDVDRIDAWAKASGITRSDAIRQLAELGLITMDKGD